MKYLICLLLVGCATKSEVEDIRSETKKLASQVQDLSGELSRIHKYLNYLDQNFSCYNDYALVCQAAATATNPFVRMSIQYERCHCVFDGEKELIYLEPKYAKSVLADCKESK